jgi:hypothetical protein
MLLSLSPPRHYAHLQFLGGVEEGENIEWSNVRLTGCGQAGRDSCGLLSIAF